MDALTKWSATAVAKAKPPLSLKRLALIALGCALALAASGYGAYCWAVDRFFQSTDDAYVGAMSRRSLRTSLASWPRFL